MERFPKDIKENIRASLSSQFDNLNFDMKLSAILVLCMIASACAEMKVQKIAGGSEVEISSYPSLVSIRINNEHHCGGTLLNKEWILTVRI